ncbi:MAG TPA: cytochrome c peroxidase, partial [Planctomycetaceae bacterium]|nr:cytochrome c peroxidase [Planctomycetaceae bacterium]
RIPVGANPRGIAVSKDGKFVAVANRLDDSIVLIDATTNNIERTIPVNNADFGPRNALVRQGEKLFHSGALSFSGQFSCASCHPDGQTDGLNWDLPADGFNNFHNTKTLLGTAGTAPYGWEGTSPDLRARFTGTLRHLFQHEPMEEEAAALEAYLAQLDYPAKLPHRVDPESTAARRGRALFEGAARCSDCHNGSKFTDRKTHDVGTASGADVAFDTPSLVRISETAPYLHDGRAETLAEIFTRHNSSGEHGGAADLSAEQLVDLVEYLKSL